MSSERKKRLGHGRATVAREGRLSWGRGDGSSSRRYELRDKKESKPRQYIRLAAHPAGGKKTNEIPREQNDNIIKKKQEGNFQDCPNVGTRKGSRRATNPIYQRKKMSHHQYTHIWRKGKKAERGTRIKFHRHGAKNSRRSAKPAR